MLTKLSFLAISAGVLAATVLRAAEPSMSEAELVKRTQELYDAVVPGDQRPWNKHYADDCIFHDEKGRSFDKAKLMADIVPLPKGYSGSIKVVNPQSIIVGDTAVFSYDTIETETIFGQQLHARYHGTDTWMRRKGQWQIIASQTMRYYEDPALGRADPSKFGEFTGTYELAEGQTRKILAEDGNLFVERNRKREQLYPETGDIFFRKGVEGRILFRADANGKVDALIDRRNNEDVIWKKKA